jgi:hypothetical protein
MLFTDNRVCWPTCWEKRISIYSSFSQVSYEPMSWHVNCRSEMFLYNQPQRDKVSTFHHELGGYITVCCIRGWNEIKLISVVCGFIGCINWSVVVKCRNAKTLIEIYIITRHFIAKCSISICRSINRVGNGRRQHCLSPHCLWCRWNGLGIGGFS